MRIQDIDAEFWWGTFVMAVLATVVLLVVTAIAHDHRVTSYYANYGGVQNSCRWIPAENRTVCNTPVCVYADIPWSVDTKVYCNSDPDKAIEQIRQLNQTLK